MVLTMLMMMMLLTVLISAANDNADTGHGWLVEPSARETKVRRKMSRNFRGSSGFFLSDFWEGSCFFYLPSFLTLSGLTLSASAPCMRRTCSALARFLFHENQIYLHFFSNLGEFHSCQVQSQISGWCQWRLFSWLRSKRLTPEICPDSLIDLICHRGGLP